MYICSPKPKKSPDVFWAQKKSESVIQTFFVPRRGALCLPNPRPLPEEGEMVAELRMNL